MESNTFPSVFPAYTYAVGGRFFWQVKEERTEFTVDSRCLIAGGMHQMTSYLQSLIAESETAGT